MSDVDLADVEVNEETPSGKTYKKFEGKVLSDIDKEALKKIGKWEE